MRSLVLPDGINPLDEGDCEDMENSGKPIDAADKLSTCLEFGAGVGSFHSCCVVGEWIVHHRLAVATFVSGFAAIALGMTAAILPNETTFYFLGVALVVFVAWVVLLGRNTSPPPRAWRFVFAGVMLLLMASVTFMPWFFGGLDSCRDNFETWLESSGFSESAVSAQVAQRDAFNVTFLGLTWVCVTITVACTLKEHPPSLYARQAMWCIALISCVCIDHSVHSLLSWCAGPPEQDGSMVVAAVSLMEGAQEVGFVVHTTLIWTLVLKRLRALESELEQELGSRRLLGIMALFVSFGAVYFAFKLLGALFYCAVLAGLASCCAVALGAQACRCFYRPVKALWEEVRNTSGAPRQEALWAARALTLEQLSVSLTGASCSAALLSHMLGALRDVCTDNLFRRDAARGNMISMVLFHVDAVCNALALAAVSGICARQWRKTSVAPRSLGSPRPWTSTESQSTSAVWDAKVSELAHRGFCLEALLDFYVELLSGAGPMPSFDPQRSTTRDVVWEAIIPLSRDDADSAGGTALSARWRPEGGLLAEKMVTHAWSNVFTHLVAAVVSDACGDSEYEHFIPKLAEGQIEQIKEKLRSSDSLHSVYWICAFCVNQHSCICGGFGSAPQTLSDFHMWDRMRRNSVTGELFPTCPCHQPKFLNAHPDQCELNKFHAMMALLATRQPAFSLIIAADQRFDVLTRVWCIAEIAEAESSNIEQNLVLYNAQAIDGHYQMLKRLDVNNCEASRPEDKVAILQRIDDVDAFNERLQLLIFGAGGLLGKWMDAERKLQTVGRVVSRVFGKQRSGST